MLGRDTFDGMLREDPQNDIAKYNLAALSHKVGDAIRQIEAITATSLPYYERSLELRESLRDQEQYSKDLTRDRVNQALANSYLKQLEIRLLLGAPAHAYEFYRKYSEIYPNYQHEAFPLFAGDVHLHLGRTDDAQKWYERALAQSRSRITGAPNLARRFLAESLGKLGDLQLQLGDSDSAIGYYQQCFEAQAELVRTDPENSDAVLKLALAEYRLGSVSLALKNPENAAGHFGAARDLAGSESAKDPTNAYKQVQHFLALARCGEHQQAAQMAGALHERVAADPGMLFYVASCYAICASVSGSDSASSGADNKSLREIYATRAIDTLRQAVAHGYKDHYALEHDPDLQSVRDHADLVTLIESLKHEQVHKL
jgi:tetratricopeptide (TPR) repeat protein